jgi:hypothetical protein
MCDSKELLVGFLYDELDPSAKRTFANHLVTCVECRDELAELGVTRGQIALWTPPESELGFRIVRGVAAPPPPRFRMVPAWGLAAAAVLVLAAGAAIANLQVHYNSDGLVVRTGWNHALESGRQNAAANVATVDWKTQADQLDRRLRDLESSRSARPQSPAVQNASTSGMSDAEVLQRVREMLAQSETRQQRTFATRLTEMTRELDAQRRLDLATIDQGMTRLQTTSGAEARKYRDYLSRVIQATAYQQK